LRQSTEQNLLPKYSNGTFPVMSAAHKKHLVITAPDWLKILLSAASALFSLSLNLRNLSRSISSCLLTSFSWRLIFSFSFLILRWAFFLSFSS
jgi:hypothetical protein